MHAIARIQHRPKVAGLESAAGVSVRKIAAAPAKEGLKLRIDTARLAIATDVAARSASQVPVCRISAKNEKNRQAFCDRALEAPRASVKLAYVFPDVVPGEGATAPRPGVAAAHMNVVPSVKVAGGSNYRTSSRAKGRRRRTGAWPLPT